MDFNRALPPEIEQALAREWVVLTANQRAARTLRHACDLRQHALGNTTWEPPAILAWESWTVQLWNRLLLDGRSAHLLLDAQQERIVWHAVITADTGTASLRPVEALAQTAADAWKQLHDYRGRPSLHSYPGNSDTRAFARWVDGFERRCNRAQYLTEAQLAETLLAHVAAGHFNLPEGFLLVGFDNQTPAQTELFKAVRAAGAEIDELGPGAPPVTDSPSRMGKNLTLASAPNEHSELAACAHWLRDRLTRQPEASIAVITPNIDKNRAEIDRVFRHILAPELNDIAATAAEGPYEFSLGVPLARTPLAAIALDVLHWSIAPLPLDRVCALLLSPHFAASHTPAERLARAEFDAFVLRRQHLLQPRLSLGSLLNIASRPQYGDALPVLLHHLGALRPLIHRGEMSAKRAFSDWTETIHELLEAAGWAQLALLESVEFQTRRKWDEALDNLAALDFEGARVSFADALAVLERIAAETVFAPESRHAPIQIMGPLESAGSTFDAVWFLRANDADWPAASSPNPLLPWQLQRFLAMPGADPLLHTAQARRTTQRIAATAADVVFSYALQSADGPQRSSPILAGLALQQRRAADLAPDATTSASVALETFIDEPTVPAPPDTVLQGGAGILQLQAACGFRAFAEKRLFSCALDSPSLGLDPAERGSVVHAALQAFWTEVKSQAALKAMSQAQRDAQLARSIDSALSGYLSRSEPGWSRAYLNTERDRLLTLLGQWLDYEAHEREPFIVQSTEEKLDRVKIGELHLDVRIDRVDLALGKGNSGGLSSEIILDYKTGASAPKDWIGPRPDAPQLPLYAVVSNKPTLAAVAFASVRPGNLMGITGYEAVSGVLPKAGKLNAPSLAAQVDEWKEVLKSLADEFHAGNASVSPKHYPQTCEYCEQRLLCRLNPSILDPDTLEEIEEESEEDELG